MEQPRFIHMNTKRDPLVDENLDIIHKLMKEVLAKREEILTDFAKAYLASSIPEGMDPASAARHMLDHIELVQVYDVNKTTFYFRPRSQHHES